jgi:hypothetical protein
MAIGRLKEEHLGIERVLKLNAITQTTRDMHSPKTNL